MKTNNAAAKPLEMVRQIIDMRIESAHREFQDHLEAKRWSQIAGWDGIETGLMMARNVVDEELKSIYANKD